MLLVSPYHGGSHESWADGLRAHSRHSIDVLPLPARFWKWRMHGGAITLARRFLESADTPDLIVATDMLDLTTFLALTREATAAIPTLLYMHENQLTYPLPENPSAGPMRRQGGERDRHYAFINYASMLAADCVVFNSAFHLRALLDGLTPFLSHFPEHNDIEGIELVAAKSRVVPVGIDCNWLDGAAADTRAAGRDRVDPPLVIWNQRWEYDKHPARFFEALEDIASRDVDFRLALCGQAFRRQPVEFDEAREVFGDRLVHFGYAEPDRYRELLWQATVTASTADHEFFGIAVLEAMACGTVAILPDRLSYPGLLSDGRLDDSSRRRCLYRTTEGLVRRLEWCLTQPTGAAKLGAELSEAARTFDWRRVAPTYDELFARMAQHPGRAAHGCRRAKI